MAIVILGPGANIFQKFLLVLARLFDLIQENFFDITRELLEYSDVQKR